MLGMALVFAHSWNERADVQESPIFAVALVLIDARCDEDVAKVKPKDVLVSMLRKVYVSDKSSRLQRLVLTL